MTRSIKVQLYNTLLEKQKLLAEKSLYSFLKYFAWPALMPSTEFMDNWHIRAICEHLEAINKGYIRRLIINMPYRMLKSTICSQAFPAWEWTTQPNMRYLTSSYAADVAIRDAVDARKIIQSQKYQLCWGDKFSMLDDQNVKKRYENNMGGGRVITSTDSAGTGFGGNRVIVDDPVSARQADNALARAASIEWWRGTGITRVNNYTKDAFIVVHQRLNQDDLTGYLLENEKGWEHLVLPMRFDESLKKTTCIGFEDPRKIHGELLFPARMPESAVLEAEASLGHYHADAQLQQNPSSRGGTIFAEHLWNYYHSTPDQMALDMDEILWSWDCSFKAHKDSDFVAGLCIGRKGACKYLLARICQRMSFSDTKKMIEQCAARAAFKRKTVAVLIEDAANGPAILDALRNDVPGLTPITPQGGKTTRAYAIQPQHEAGNFFLPSEKLDGHDWVSRFVHDFGRFPNIKNDDEIDAWTQGVNWFTTRENQRRASPKPFVAGQRSY